MDPRHVPTALTLSRIPLAAAGWWAAWTARPLSVLWLALACVATDVLDGVAARRLGVASRWGANVDSMVDLLFYVSLLGWTIRVRPAVLEMGLQPLIGGFLTAYLLVFLGGLLLHRDVAIHNALSRLAATVGTTVALWWIVFGVRAWMVVPVVLVLGVDLGQRIVVLGRALRQAPRAPAPREP